METEVAGRIDAEARRRVRDAIVIGRSGLSGTGVPPRREDRTLKRLRSMLETGWRQYLFLSLAFAVLLAAGFMLSGLIGYRSVALVYLASVICLSLVARPVPVACFAVASASALNFFLIPPYFTFDITLLEDAILFGIYFLAAFVTSMLVSSVRANERLFREKERRASFLFESLERLASCDSTRAAAEAAAGIASSYFGTGVVTFAAPPGGGRFAGPFGTEADRAAADADGLVDSVGGDPGRLPDATGRYVVVPAVAGGATVGAIAAERGAGWAKADLDLMAALGRALALVVDRENDESRKREATLAVESERLSRVLLDTVSHELRTPLTTVTGAISALRDDRLAENATARRDMLAAALGAADRLNGVFDDLLSASRMESGMLRLRRDTVDASEVAGTAVNLAREELAGRPVRVSVDEDAPPVSVDLGLLARMTANLLKNAGRYSRPGGAIGLSLRTDGAWLRVEVRDEGPGMPPELCVRPFRKFDRGRRPSGGGLGLGLALCEGIAAAHGGSLAVVENGPDAFSIEAVIPIEGRVAT